MPEHFIAGVGTDVRSDQCYFSVTVHSSLEDAVQYLADVFELSKRRRRRLRDEHYLELRGPQDGAAYCEITSCACERPRVHEDV